MGRSFNPAGGGSTPFEGAELLAPFVCPVLSASVNDYLVPQQPGFLNASVIVVGASAPINITGLAGWAPNREVLILNGGAQTITLPNVSGASLAQHRFQFGGTNVGLVQFASVKLVGLSGGGWGCEGAPPSASANPAPSNATYVTTTDESGVLPNSKVLGAGTFAGAQVLFAANTFFNTVASVATWADPPEYDTGAATLGAAFWNSATPTRLTAPVAGFYQATACAYWDAAGQAQLSLYFAKNGASNFLYGWSSGTSSSVASPNPFLGLPLSVPFQLAEGDYIEVYAQVFGGDCRMDLLNNATFFAMHQLK